VYSSRKQTLKACSKLTLAGFVVLLICACATPSQTLRLKNNPLDFPTQVELTSVPFYPQRDYQCGPAALATVLNHYQPITSAEQLIPRIYIPKLKGSLQAEILATARSFDRLVLQQDGKLGSIFREVAAGNPVLVMQNLGLESLPFWHYAVVIGYDLEQQNIILRSGEISRLSRPFALFERTWGRSGYWSVVIVPVDVMPITATEQQFSRAVITLEQSASAATSLAAYNNGLTRWPDNFLLHMGRGNAAYAQKDYALAEKAFRTAVEINPQKAEAWNNLAYALFKRDKKQEALQAVEKAILLAPDVGEFRQSREEISGQP